MFAVLFIAVYLAAILTRIYTYFGSMGTLGGREESIARAQCLRDSSFSSKRQYLTGNDLDGVPENIAEQY
jgi:hypothetical protein